LREAGRLRGRHCRPCANNCSVLVAGLFLLGIHIHLVGVLVVANVGERVCLHHVFLGVIVFFIFRWRTDSVPVHVDIGGDVTLELKI
jgi:hypothetical protein